MKQWVIRNPSVLNQSPAERNVQDGYKWRVEAVMAKCNSGNDNEINLQPLLKRGKEKNEESKLVTFYEEHIFFYEVGRVNVTHKPSKKGTLMPGFQRIKMNGLHMDLSVRR